MDDKGHLDGIFDIAKTLDFELRIIDINNRNAIEYTKISADFTKTIVNSLVAINSGGLVAMPALSVFFGLDHSTLPEKAKAFGPSALLFSAGLISAILCTLYVGRNFARLRDHTMASVERDKANYHHLRVLILGRDSASQEKALAEAQEKLKPHDRKVKLTYIWAYVFGWTSLILFLIGGLLLVVRH